MDIETIDMGFRADTDKHNIVIKLMFAAILYGAFVVLKGLAGAAF